MTVVYAICTKNKYAICTKNKSFMHVAICVCKNVSL